MPSSSLLDHVDASIRPEQDNAASGGAQRRPDAVDRLWAPNRMTFMNGEQDRRGHEDPGCGFCGLTALRDEESFVVHRGQYAYVVLNRFPYINGHLMVIPYGHTADYSQLRAAEHLEISELTAQAVRVLGDALGAHGFNVGMNLGEHAGASIPEHLHQHVVPRWIGDTNFMPMLSHTRVIPQLLEETWLILAQAWSSSSRAR